ncbi:MAG: acetyl-CoA carboxylase carboxyltransferase component, partial [Myxococcota bacterium]
EEACLSGIRALLGHLGSPVVHAEQEEGPTADLLPDSVLDLMPADRTGPWDVRALIRQIVDPPLEGQAINLFELKPDRAPNVITALGRIAGRSVGIVANNPQVMSGVIDVGAAQKMTRFIERCSNFSIPLVFLADTPGFLIGSEAERQGILAHGAALLRVVAEARVLRLTVVLRRAYGAGYYAMCGRAFEPGLLVAWPTAEISVLAPEGIVSIAMARRIDNAHDPDAERVRLAEAIRPQFDIFHAAERGFVDDVIDPRETRRVLLRALAG